MVIPSEIEHKVKETESDKWRDKREELTWTIFKSRFVNPNNIAKSKIRGGEIITSLK